MNALSNPQADYGRMLLAASAALGLLYGFGMLPDGAPVLAMISKGAPVALLALYAAFNRNMLLAVALGLGAAGDVFLAARFEAAFMAGLSAFLVGHLVYIRLIWPSRIQWSRLPDMRRSAIGLTVGLAILQGWYLLPHIAGPVLPVMLYTAVLAAMTALAIASRYPLRLVGLGAVLFFLSDLVLGISFFSPDVDVPRWLNWFLYYPGQLLLAIGLVRGNPDSSVA